MWNSGFDQIEKAREAQVLKERQDEWPIRWDLVGRVSAFPSYSKGKPKGEPKGKPKGKAEKIVKYVYGEMMVGTCGDGDKTREGIM